MGTGRGAGLEQGAGHKLNGAQGANDAGRRVKTGQGASHLGCKAENQTGRRAQTGQDAGHKPNGVHAN